MNGESYPVQSYNIMAANKTKILIGFYIAIFFTTINFGAPIYAEELKPIRLLQPEFDRGKLLMEALKERKSTRSFSSRELPIDILSNLLWAAFGINRPGSGKRTAPSASNIQEIDIYVAMKKGLYLYNPAQHALEPVMAGDIREFTGKQEFTKVAPINLIYVANFSKLGADTDNKIFYSANHAGYISQNVYLFCASEDLATVVLGWVDKPALKKIMNLKKDQEIILTQPVGYSQE